MSEEISVDKNDKRTFWSMHIQRCKESNLKQVAYCNQAGINYGSFAKWKSVLFPKQKVEKNRAFVPVKIDSIPFSQITQPQFIQVKLVTGHLVQIPTTMEAKQIATLIHYLSTPHA